MSPSDAPLTDDRLANSLQSVATAARLLYPSMCVDIGTTHPNDMVSVPWAGRSLGVDGFSANRLIAADHPIGSIRTRFPLHRR